MLRKGQLENKDWTLDWTLDWTSLNEVNISQIIYYSAAQ